MYLRVLKEGCSGRQGAMGSVNWTGECWGKGILVLAMLGKRVHQTREFCEEVYIRRGSAGEKGIPDVEVLREKGIPDMGVLREKGIPDVGVLGKSYTRRGSAGEKGIPDVGMLGKRVYQTWECWGKGYTRRGSAVENGLPDMRVLGERLYQTWEG